SPSRLYLGDQGQQTRAQSGQRCDLLSRVEPDTILDRRRINAPQECAVFRSMVLGGLSRRNRSPTRGTILPQMGSRRSGKCRVDFTVTQRRVDSSRTVERRCQNDLAIVRRYQLPLCVSQRAGFLKTAFATFVSSEYLSASAEEGRHSRR